MPAEHTEVDVAVVGLGSGGENLATRCAEHGLRVVAFEPDRVGGECPFVACIPSKVLLHHVAAGSDWATAIEHRRSATSGLDDEGHAESLEKAGVELVRARARLVGERVVEADGRRWRAEHVVLATGGSASVPDLDGLDPDRIWTSDDLLTADRLPESLVVLGGGAIGCELATVQAGLGGPEGRGGRAVVVEVSSRIGGPDLDDEVAELLCFTLEDRGVEVRTNADAERVEHTDAGVRLHLGDGTVVEAERLLVAVGKDPNWDGLGLEELGLETTVDDGLRVGDTDWLRAVGDLNGLAPWTHGANHQARWLADALAGQAWPEGRQRHLPHGIFTLPPAAAVGLSAGEAAEQGLDVVRGVATYDDIARPMTDELGEGRVVVVVDRVTRKLVGCSGVGERFDEIVATFSVMLQQGLTADEAVRSVIAFPTVTQVLTPAVQAALDQLGSA